MIGVRYGAKRVWFTVEQLTQTEEAKEASDTLRAPLRRTKPIYRPMTDQEQALALALSPGRIRYRVGSGDKRFAREMSAVAATENPEITAPQALYLLKLKHRYRRQLPRENVSRETDSKGLSDGR